MKISKKDLTKQLNFCIIKTMKITKEQFHKLYSDNITKKEYDTILKLIDDRFYEIMKTLCPKLSWVDYANGYDETDGFFDPSEYKENIDFDGKGVSLLPPFDECSVGNGMIPTRWLWEDFEEEYNQKVSEHKQKEELDKARSKEKENQRKQENEKIWASIKSKLNTDEMKYILKRIKK